MRKLAWYVARSVIMAILAVLIIMLGLDTLFGLIEELSDVNDGYRAADAFQFVLLSIPGRVVLYVPYSALVGCLIGLGMLAGTSELVVMRAAGISIFRISWLVLQPVLVIVVAAMLLGEFVTPKIDQYALGQRSLAQGGQQLETEHGFWSRDGREYVHINAVTNDGQLLGVSRYQYDEDGRLQASSFAQTADYQQGTWYERNVASTQLTDDHSQTQAIEQRQWQTHLKPKLLDVLTISGETLGVMDLFSYASFRENQGLKADKYWLAFWEKALQPLATISLVLVAISFIFGPLRQVTPGFRVFIGVMVGVLFKTAQAILGPSSLVFGFSPLLAVAIPIAICLAAGFWMIGRYR
ncbi:LPS export ABC transporter permease LptG [Halioxenophilus aromaticivorans]|uniref:LPS export ABC transporter permease LptG n=1 Tax=Halioxenophilus aromaticivorans TaxID=1306992 RepID=A0AAV3U0W5_9ALTE